MTAALRLDGVGRMFGNIHAVKDVSLEVASGEFFTFLGPSGSGKSTVLRMIAGLEKPDVGTIAIDGKDVTPVPPWGRDIGMVFQQYALFPHMNVADNVGYGMKMRGAPTAEIDRTVDGLLELAGLSGFQKRSVARLSGGEQQRVALARSLAHHPAVLLLDEPLGALDERVRREMQRELKRIQRETRTTFIYVTHDQEEALTMSDRIAVFHAGTIVQCDVPDKIFERPRTRFVASFFRGFNVLEGKVLKTSEDVLEVRTGGHRIYVPLRGVGAPPDGSSVSIGVRSEKLYIGAAASGRAVSLDGLLRDVVYKGTVIDHIVELSDGQSVAVTSVRREVADDARNVTVSCATDDLVLLDL